MLTDDDFFTIMINAIRDTQVSMPRALFGGVIERITLKLSVNKDDVVETQEIYEDVIACYNYYNDFVESKGLNMDLIEPEMYDVVLNGMNTALEIMSQLNDDELEEVITKLEEENGE